MAKSLEELVDDMLDREAIRDLVARYAKLVWQDQDGSNAGAIVEMFSEDGALRVGPPRNLEVKGHPALLKQYEQILKNAPLRPFVHNHVVDLQDHEHASGIHYFELRSVKENLQVFATGSYADEYVKVGGQWKFKSRLSSQIALA